jgi:hypothetical protein
MNPAPYPDDHRLHGRMAKSITKKITYREVDSSCRFIISDCAENKILSKNQLFRNPATNKTKEYFIISFIQRSA